MNKRHYEHTLPNIRGSLSNTYITTMNYSVAIFVYSRMIRYPDNAITELRYSRISKQGQPGAKGARILPDIDISKSPFAEVYKYQSINGDYKEKT